MDEASCRWLRRRVAHRANLGADRPSVCGSSGASVSPLHGTHEPGRNMNFYTLDYIVSHQSLDATRRLAAIIVLLVVALAFSALYLHNRVKTRWRDAGIGLFVFSLVLLGIQTEQYLKVSDQQSQAQLLVGFMEGVAIDHGVQAREVMVNKTSLQDGMIVRFNEEDYTVHLNNDNNSFTLERTHVIDHGVYVNGER